MKAFLALAIIATLIPADETNQGDEQINALLNKNKHDGVPVLLKGDDGLVTKAKFKPPVQIVIVAKTDSTNIRIGYAADQAIFNWERNLTELRIDGGPANGKHKPGAGAIPTKKFIKITWVVTRTKQKILVDGELRYEHAGDYSKINNPVSVASHRSNVTVKSIKVRQLPADTQ